MDSREAGDGRGVCIWLTGPGGAGKSTLTASLVPMLESTGAEVTVLDVVPELRKLRGERTSRGKLIRKAFVSKEVVRHGGVVVCVTISSRREIREQARSMVGEDAFVEVFVDAPDDVVAQRKAGRPKKPALRKRIRRSLKSVVARFGLDGEGGYERSPHPDVHVETTQMSPSEGAELVMATLADRGKISWEPTAPRRQS